MTDLTELMQPAELHPDLLPYVECLKRFDALRHPYVYMVPYSPPMNNMANKTYLYKKEAIEKAKEKKDWVGYIWMHEKPYRMQAFSEVCGEMSDEKYWQFLGEVWVDVENIWQCGYAKFFLFSNRPGREHLMDDYERNVLAKMPDEFVIYRGHQRKNRKGLSWTLNYARARWFANRYGKKGVVSSAICKKSDVIALFLGRGEAEIIINPEILTLKTERKTHRPPWLEKVASQVASASIANTVDHGTWHWDKVDRNVIRMAAAAGADLTVCRLFAILHDCKRDSEGHDPDHGRRAAAHAKIMKLPITEKQLDVLCEALADHNDGKVTNDPTIGVCWDADRLDLLRCGEVPDPKQLSTEIARSLVGKI